jgi:molybdenum cofactor cytidylyltransferase
MQQKNPLSHAKAPPQVAGLVLAAGRGRRFDPTGRQHKLSVNVADGQAMLRVSCLNLLAWVDSLTVVIGAHSTELADLLTDVPAKVLICPQADQGLGSSLRWGLAASEPSIPAIGWLIALGDMPFIAPQTYADVAHALRAGAPAVRPLFEGQPGHPVAIAAGLKARFAQISDEQGLAPILKGVDTQWLAINDPGCVKDIDYPADLLGAP